MKELTQEAKVLYRARWENVNHCAETFEQQKIEIIFDEYTVIKQTTKTCTIKIGKYHNGKYGDKSNTVVLKDQSGKRFAYLTKERALKAFITKRKSYKQWLLTHQENNDRLIDIAVKLSEKGGNGE